MSEAEQYAALIGQVVLGRYRVVRLLAVGGMGVIYLARSEGAAGFVRPVTVKRILPAKTSAESVIKGFAREARILSNLRHPGIVGITDFREEHGAYLMVLDYVHGFDLGRWQRYLAVRQERFRVDLAVHVVLQMLDALHYAHTLTGPDGVPLNIVHRDVSPSNLLIDVDGHVKLTDFGIARMQASSEEFRTEEGKIRGKFHYLAPELFGRTEPGARTDVFSAGVLLHELLAGLNEFRADDFQTTVARVLGHELTPLDRLRDDVSPALAAIVSRATHKKPAERFATAAELAAALREAREEDGEAVARRFRETVARDFHDPQLPEVSGAEPLRVLEQAWKEPGLPARQQTSSLPRSPTPARRTPAADRAPDPPTAMVSVPPPRVVQQLSGRESEARQTRPARAVWIALLAGVPLAALALTQPWAASEPESPTQFVLVQGDVTPIGDAEEARAEDAITATIASPEVVAKAPAIEAPAPRPRPRSAQDALTRAFAKQERRVEQCFVDHRSDADGAGQISLRFRVDAAGEVLAAEVAPKELATTPLGACLVRIARQTRFGAVGKAISFRIPVTVRRVGGE